MYHSVIVSAITKGRIYLFDAKVRVSTSFLKEKNVIVSDTSLVIITHDIITMGVSATMALQVIVVLNHAHNMPLGLCRTRHVS